MGTPNANPKSARIESLWATGRTTHQIAAETGAALEYVQYIVRLIQSHSKAIRPLTADNDDAAHLAKIHKAHGTGFPFYPAVPV